MPVFQTNFTDVDCNIVSMSLLEYKKLPEEIMVPQLHRIMNGCGIYHFTLTPNYAGNYTGTLFEGYPVGTYVVYLSEILYKLSDDEQKAIIYDEIGLMLNTTENDLSLPSLLQADKYAASKTSPLVLFKGLNALIRSTAAFMHGISPEFVEENIFQDIITQPDVITRLDALRKLIAKA